MGWWRHFVSMPDRERARVLANASLGLIIVLLYSLGGLSVYLRARYLGAGALGAERTSTATPTAPPTLMSGEVQPTALPTATLYPTLTPAGPDSAPGSVQWPTITPSPRP